MINDFASLADLLKKMQVEPKPKKKPIVKNKCQGFRFTKKFCDEFCVNPMEKKKTAREDNLDFLVTCKGRKSWRVFLDKRRSMTIGYYPEMSIEQARKRCDEILRGKKA